MLGIFMVCAGAFNLFMGINAGIVIRITAFTRIRCPSYAKKGFMKHYPWRLA
jgi:hypothetical protein